MTVCLDYKENFLKRVISSGSKWDNEDSQAFAIATKVGISKFFNWLSYNLSTNRVRREYYKLRGDILEVDRKLAGYRYGKEILDSRERTNGHINAFLFCLGRGLEIGGSVGNEFGLLTKNLDIPNENDNKLQVDNCGLFMPIDYKRNTEKTKLRSKRFDYIVSSHVLEHIGDPISVLLEWNRILKKWGILFLVLPHKERSEARDRGKERTNLSHLIADCKSKKTFSDLGELKYHKHFWITEDIAGLINWTNKKGYTELEVVNKVDRLTDRNDSFLFVLRKLS
jgi:SAM-dependent methyltransferase